MILRNQVIRVTRWMIVILALVIFSTTNRAAEATRLRVGVPTLSMVVIAFTAAKERGYYKEEGLDVEFVWMSAPVVVQALIGGNVEFSTVSGSAIPAMLSGAPLRIIFSSYQRPMFWLFSKPEINYDENLGEEESAFRASVAGQQPFWLKP